MLNIRDLFHGDYFSINDIDENLRKIPLENGSKTC